MPIHKWVMFAVDGNDNGWSYPLFRDQPDASLDETGSLVDTLAKRLAAGMGSGTKFTYVRESLVGSRGTALLSSFGTSAAFKGNASKTIEQAPSCLLIRCFSSDWKKKKKLFYHGVWDETITDTKVTNTPGWTAVRDAIIAELKNGWGWMTVSGKVTSAVASVAAVAGNRVQINFASDIFLPPFDGLLTVPILIKNVESIPKMRNPLIVIPSDARTCVTLRQFALPVNLSGSGTRNVMTFQPIQRVLINRVTKHKVGRPFKPQAGGRDNRK